MEPNRIVLEISLPEVRGDVQAISARLSAAGFDDLDADGLVVLAAMAGPAAKVEGLLRTFAVSEREVSTTIDALVLQGYLEPWGAQNGIYPAARTLTEWGWAAVEAIICSVKAMRWANFPFREGDIVISAPVKSGMTWMQMICALLIFQTPDLPAPLSKLSPWLDWNKVSRDEVYAPLASQEHRRFIKTHSPLKVILKEVPADSRVTYIVVARHPLDVMISMYHQIGNFADSGSRLLSGPSEPDSRSLPMPREWLIGRLNQYEASPSSDELTNSPFNDEFINIMSHLSDAWARRNEPNVVLLHYEDLSADLQGQMRGLAARLGVTVPDPAWPDLVKAATFEQMRAAADRLQPVGTLKDNTAFFQRGTSGSGRELLSTYELARYHAHTAQLIPADLFTWLHREEMARGC